MTSFSQQLFKSEVEKWFQLQKNIVSKIVTDFSLKYHDVKFAIATYGKSMKYIVKPFTSFGDSRVSIMKSLKAVTAPNGPSNVLDTLQEASKIIKLNSESDTKTKILIIFVEKEIEDNDFKEVIQVLKTRNVKILPIITGPHVSDKNLDDILDKEGDVVMIPEIEEPKPSILDVLDELLKKGMKVFFND